VHVLGNSVAFAVIAKARNVFSELIRTHIFLGRSRLLTVFLHGVNILYFRNTVIRLILVIRVIFREVTLVSADFKVAHHFLGTTDHCLIILAAYAHHLVICIGA